MHVPAPVPVAPPTASPTTVASPTVTTTTSTTAPAGQLPTTGSDAWGVFAGGLVLLLVGLVVVAATAKFRRTRKA